MWLAIFYVFTALCMIFVLGLMNLVSRSKFRSEDGDVTTEVGFEEDPLGNVKVQEHPFPSQEELEKPHVGMEKLVQ
jgi:hypothetical protein